VKTFGELGLPNVVAQLADRPRGLRAGHGSDRLRQEHDRSRDDRQDQQGLKGHIITVEDPIEFIHRHQACIVNQPRSGDDTNSFQAALQVCAGARDPDVVLVGEMRDLETIQAALTIRGDGGTWHSPPLHTNSAAE